MIFIKITFVLISYIKADGIKHSFDIYINISLSSYVDSISYKNRNLIK